MNELRTATRAEVRKFLDRLEIDRALRLAAWRERSAQNANPSFSPNPAISPLPPAGAWVYSFGGAAANTLQATTTATSTAVTVVWPGTSGLYVGQQITGMGILPNTTIAAIGSATAITLSLATGSTGVGAGPLTVYGLGGPFTAQNNYGAPSPAALALDVPGAALQVPENQTLVFNAASVFVPAPGQGYLALTSGATTAAAIQANIAGSWTALFTGTAGAASPIMWFATDGTNFRITSPGTGNASFVFYRFRNFPV
jgi:hypothetical protein